MSAPRSPPPLPVPLAEPGGPRPALPRGPEPRCPSAAPGAAAPCPGGRPRCPGPARPGPAPLAPRSGSAIRAPPRRRQGGGEAGRSEAGREGALGFFPPSPPRALLPAALLRPRVWGRGGRRRPGTERRCCSPSPFVLLLRERLGTGPERRRRLPWRRTYSTGRPTPSEPSSTRRASPRATAQILDLCLTWKMIFLMS